MSSTYQMQQLLSQATYYVTLMFLPPSRKKELASVEHPPCPRVY